MEQRFPALSMAIVDLPKVLSLAHLNEARRCVQGFSGGNEENEVPVQQPHGQSGPDAQTRAELPGALPILRKRANDDGAWR